MAGTLMQTLLCAPTALLHSATALARRFVVWALKGGAIPQHVAFIMDGNRRFAVRNCMSRAQGHREGYDRLVDALQWCLDLGINYVTVYAFSIENFKRPESEVDDIMDLAADKLEEILQERDLVRRHGVQVRVIGELQLLPPKVQLAAARVMSATQSHTRGVLNICFSYTSQHEISAAAEAVARGISCELIHEEDVRRALIYESLHTAGCPPVDLLIRTSGETRLSDFMLCQANHAILEFTSVFWPEFGFFNLLVSIVRFQLLLKNHHVVPPCRCCDDLAWETQQAHCLATKCDDITRNNSVAGDTISAEAFDRKPSNNSNVAQFLAWKQHSKNMWIHQMLGHAV